MIHVRISSLTYMHSYYFVSPLPPSFPCGSRSTSPQAPLPRSRATSSRGGDQDSSTLHLLSWNIDGLDRKFTCERAGVVCDMIGERRPEVVYLQEIVDSTWKILQERLGTTYFLYRDEEIATSWHYFCILMIRKESAVLPESKSPEILRFPQSQQSRYLIQMHVKFRNTRILLLTSHLESLPRDASERKKQLQTCFRIMEEKLLKDPGGVCILGGDLNLKDSELAQIRGLPENVYDVWEFCGSEAEQKYTFESSKPRFRLDRLYCCADEMKLVPKLFELVGREEIAQCGGMFPSDHFGLWAEFEI